ncbi:MAG: 50S ribosomal protein L23 [Phycisphaeraceae bacterium]|nr:50S ribosomal protein L23 [Phycisphaeraceae bacterium]
MPQATDVIKRPLITEKATWESESRNRYSFQVDMRARKPQIKTAVEELYKVRVVRISTQVRKGRYVRTRYGTRKAPSWKRATVELHPDDRIELF